METSELLARAVAVLNANHGASMATIAQQIGISRATLNRRFASREDLLRQLGERASDRWERSLEIADADAAGASGDPARIERALHTLLREYVAEADEYGFALTDVFLEQVPELAGRSEELTRRETALLAAGQQAGLLRTDVPARWLSWSIFGQLVAARDAVRFGDLGRRGLENLVTTTLLEGIRRR
ncbi:helix-turn-helix transcriptional regulator [Flexivirga sp. ID2601S]|uniref:Helix-turn-helix transcriptional regulator n=1 Tax=Flexivirga aerilata TaxID=1656889 RepID=A0A849AE43_9MICO|nr:TetR/AcrR family transcriptional regulator [Flexivirga aerilata]NNG38709.1 helix-turn-helix transcriptional regulator [Flexivirga aerilata]